MPLEEVILVNENDEQVGTMEKMEAHRRGLLHRAFSVFIYNSKGELLLQKRAANKYHSPGLWTNTCCSHPRPGETTIAAAKRRLKEEMGLEAELKETNVFTYKTEFNNDLTEHEVDHVFVGTSDAIPVINSDEVSDYRWDSSNKIKEEVQKFPHHFTSWFKIAVERNLL